MVREGSVASFQELLDEHMQSPIKQRVQAHVVDLESPLMFDDGPRIYNYSGRYTINGIPNEATGLLDPTASPQSFYQRALNTDTPTFRTIIQMQGMDHEELKKLFLLKLASILQLYGCPTHRMEYNLTRAARVLGLIATFSVMPTVTFCAFQPLSNPERRLASDVHILRVQRGYDMEKLSLVDAIAEEHHDQYNADELVDAITRLDEIIHRAPRYNFLVRCLFMGLCSSSLSCLFFHGSWVDFGISFGLGVCVSFFEWLASKSTSFTKVFEILTAVFCSFTARALSYHLPNVCVGSCSLAAVIWIIPGIDMALATTELATRNTVSGTTRLFQALFLSTMLGFGLAFGNKLVMWEPFQEFDASYDCQARVDPLYAIVLVPMAAACISLLLQATPRQCLIMVPVAISGYLVNLAAGKKFDAQTAAALGAFTVGLLGNIWANYSQTPSVIPILAGILLLVPGSLGVKGMAAFLKKDVMGGMGFAVEMISTALCITVGLFVANLFVVPRKANKGSYVNIKF